MSTGSITVGCAGKTVLVHVRGPGDLFNSYPLQVFLTRMLEAHADTFQFNLADCTQVDSTFMGVMAGLSQRLRKADKGVLQVLNASDASLDCIHRLGLNHLVDMRDDVEIPPMDDSTELEPPDLSKLDRGRHMLHAHLELSAISEANEQQFARVIRTLKANVAKHTAGGQ